MSQSVVSELAPKGVLRAGVNMSNFLLVTGRTPSGDPAGVSPDMARAIADKLGVPVQYVPFPKPGVRIAVSARSAYDLWLERNIKHATLVRSDSLASATDKFVNDKLDALAGLRPGLLTDIQKMPGARILDGQFSAVQQAVGTARTNAAAAKFLHDFVEEAKSSGLVARLIEKHKVVGRLSVAPPG